MAANAPGQSPAPAATPAVSPAGPAPDALATGCRPEESPGAFDRLRERRQTLAPASGRVAEYVLANPWGVRGLAITDLAARAGVSVNTVNRLTRDLGYRGYRDFSQA